MKLKQIFSTIVFILLSSTNASAAAVLYCGSENQLHSISLGGGTFQFPPNVLDVNISNLNHTYNVSYGEGGLRTLRHWPVAWREYRAVLAAGERYIEATGDTLYFGLEFQVFYTGDYSDDGGSQYVGYYELLVQRGGHSFEDGGVPLVFFRVVNVEWGDVLNIRAEPNAEARKVGEIPSYGNGVIGFSVEPVRGWIFVNYEGIEGWVSERYLADGRRTDNEFIGEIECSDSY